MIRIPRQDETIRPYRCQCGYHGKAHLGDVSVTCPKCQRTFGQPADPPKQTREMARRVRQMEKGKSKEHTP
jgi:hypothetical protein